MHSHHDHEQDHHHHPHHETTESGIKKAFWLNFCFAFIELIVGSFGVMLFALLRMRSDYDVQPLGMMILAVLGVLVNGYAAALIVDQLAQSQS